MAHLSPLEPYGGRQGQQVEEDGNDTVLDLKCPSEGSGKGRILAGGSDH